MPYTVHNFAKASMLLQSALAFLKFLTTTQYVTMGDRR